MMLSFLKTTTGVAGVSQMDTCRLLDCELKKTASPQRMPTSLRPGPASATINSLSGIGTRPILEGQTLRMTGSAAADLTSIPIVDARDGGPVRHALEGRARAQALRDECTGWLPRLPILLTRLLKVCPCAPSLSRIMLFWALLASGQINMRKVDGWQTLATAPIDQPIDLAA
jgi:hypothetical protein